MSTRALKWSRLTPTFSPNLARAGSRSSAPGKARLPVALLAAEGDSFAEEILDRHGGLAVHGQVRVQLRDHAVDAHLDRRDIDFLDNLHDGVDVRFQRAPDDELVGGGIRRHRVVVDVGALALLVEQLRGELLVDDLFHLLRRVTPAEVDQLPFFASADDLLDLLGRRFVDGRSLDVGVGDRLDAAQVAEDVLCFDRGGALVRPVLTARTDSRRPKRRKPQGFLHGG